MNSRIASIAMLPLPALLKKRGWMIPAKGPAAAAVIRSNPLMANPVRQFPARDIL
jgi:hypothetical protein